MGSSTKESAMSSIHEIATVTTKGQITLPKPIRQALGVDVGSKVAFDVRGSQVFVSRADDLPHQDPAISSFLGLLEKDIRSGRHITALPENLARSILAALQQPVDLDPEIEGDVAL
jgi:antitoxin PrlF